jgi:hypothetical protein
MAKKNTKKIVKKAIKSSKKPIKLFKDMKPAEKRVEIAKDVIAQLNAKKFIAVSGQYCGVPTTNKKLAQTKCEVCGIASLFMANLIRENPDIKANAAIPFPSYDDEDTTIKLSHVSQEDIWEKLEGVFDREDLEAIEDAFEARDGGVNCSGGEEFFFDEDNNDISRHFDDEQRLRLIMENIIVNKGQFISAPFHKNHFKMDIKVSATTPGL